MIPGYVRNKKSKNHHLLTPPFLTYLFDTNRFHNQSNPQAIPESDIASERTYQYLNILGGKTLGVIYNLIKLTGPMPLTPWQGLVRSTLRYGRRSANSEQLQRIVWCAGEISQKFENLEKLKVPESHVDHLRRCPESSKHSF